jgi:hypothetical protein
VANRSVSTPATVPGAFPRSVAVARGVPLRGDRDLLRPGERRSERDPDAHLDAPPLERRDREHVLEAEAPERLGAHGAPDAAMVEVPVLLGVGQLAEREAVHGALAAIDDADGEELARAGPRGVAEVEVEREVAARAAADRAPVEPRLGEVVHALEVEADGTRRPRGGERELAPVPRDPVVAGAERELLPGGGDANGVRRRARGRPAFPAFGAAAVLGIGEEPPRAVEGERVGAGGEDEREQGGHHGGRRLYARVGRVRDRTDAAPAARNRRRLAGRGPRNAACT